MAARCRRARRRWSASGSSPRRRRLQQRRPQQEDQQGRDGGGDDHLQPDRRAEQVGSEAGDAAEAEHQEGEIERQHLDHEEDEDQDEPADPRELLDGLDELHDVPPSCIEPNTRVPGGPGRTESVTAWRRRPRLVASSVELSHSMTARPSHPVRSSGKTALVTGSSRGIGADTVRYLAEAGRERRHQLPQQGAARREARRASCASSASRRSSSAPTSPIPNRCRPMFAEVERTFGSPRHPGAERLRRHGVRDGARTTRCSSTATRRSACSRRALPLLGDGSRVVFVTSHQAHFIRTTPTMPEYEPVALSKRAGEDALRERDPRARASEGIGFVVVSGDMIEGTITATLLERANPGAIAVTPRVRGQALQRVRSSPPRSRGPRSTRSPTDNTRLVGDTSSFAGE